LYTLFPANFVGALLLHVALKKIFGSKMQ